MATTLDIIANNEGSGKLTVKAPNLSTNGEVILPSSGTVAVTSQIPDTSGLATKTEVTQGLAGKAPSTHTHTKSQITDFPSIPDTSTLIPKSGARGNLAGWETYTEDGILTINSASQDSNLITSTQLTISAPEVGKCYTKIVHWNCGPGSTITLPQYGYWSGGSAPEIKAGLGLVVVNAVYPYTIVSYQHYKDA